MTYLHKCSQCNTHKVALGPKEMARACKTCQQVTAHTLKGRMN